MCATNVGFELGSTKCCLSSQGNGMLFFLAKSFLVETMFLVTTLFDLQGTTNNKNAN